jgi:hypothetical protein
MILFNVKINDKTINLKIIDNLGKDVYYILNKGSSLIMLFYEI